jgi:hypothetical protein
MNLDELKSKLGTFKKENIIVSSHAALRAKFRKIDLEEVKENIVNPEKLVYAEQQKAKHEGEEKYDCYFAESKGFSYRYVLVINGKVIIVTIIKINKSLQRILEKKLK